MGALGAPPGSQPPRGQRQRLPGQAQGLNVAAQDHSGSPKARTRLSKRRSRSAVGTPASAGRASGPRLLSH